MQKNYVTNSHDIMINDLEERQDLGNDKNVINMGRAITTEEFVRILWQGFSDSLSLWMNQREGNPLENGGPKDDGGKKAEIATEIVVSCKKNWGLEEAREHGWAEAEDLLRSKEPLRRSSAARILHEFMLRELGERDLKDIGAARGLLDLYDCHVCVNHVAQVYCKGIMPAFREGIFGMRESMSPEEAREILRRLFSDERRKGQGKVSHDQREIQGGQDGKRCKPIALSQDAAREFLLEHPEAIHIDVRTPWEYDKGHPAGARNLPLLQLLEEPTRVCQFMACMAEEDSGQEESDKPSRRSSDSQDGTVQRRTPLVLGCDGGYRSEMAADCLVKAGFLKVYHYGWG